MRSLNYELISYSLNTPTPEKQFHYSLIGMHREALRDQTILLITSGQNFLFLALWKVIAFTFHCPISDTTYHTVKAQILQGLLGFCDMGFWGIIIHFFCMTMKIIDIQYFSLIITPLFKLFSCLLICFLLLSFVWKNYCVI